MGIQIATENKGGGGVGIWTAKIMRSENVPTFQFTSWFILFGKNTSYITTYLLKRFSIVYQMLHENLNMHVLVESQVSMAYAFADSVLIFGDYNNVTLNKFVIC